MRNKTSLFSFRSWLGAASVFIGVFALAFMFSKPAQADNGGIIINVKQELGSNLAGATVDIQCAGGTYTNLGTTDGSGNATVLQAGVPAGANCSNTETVDVRVTMAGYVTKTVTAIGAYATGSQNTFNVTNVLFTIKIDVLNNEANVNIMPTSGTPWSAGAGLTLASQTYDSGHWYLAASGSGNLSFNLDGYVQATISPTASASSQLVSTNDFIDVRFSHKVIVKDELGNALTPTSVTAGAANVACTIVSNTAYCPVLEASDNTLANGFVITKDGYVTTVAADVPLAGNRTAGSDLQQTTTMTTGNGLKYAVKATVVSDTAAAISSATVNAGDGGSISCTENASTGIYFCAVPLAETNVLVYSSKAGFQTGVNSYTDRTVGTDAQRAITLTMSAVTSGNTGGGGGGSYTPPATPVTPPVTPATPPATPSEPTPTPSEPASGTPAETPAVISAPVLPMDIVSVLGRERDMIAAQANAETYFINTGTATTMKLGAGERGAAVSSFKEAYGHAPKTSAEWLDVLNIANGRWPLTVNKAVEARAAVNFSAVYGRTADMKNSTDVNALKMMGYGVRGSKARDLKAEASASARFKSTFGFNPTTARHWNVVRAIAYSGVVK